jgi:D-arabinose 1-dehydrogenase-like Zn-dependent alcohol dehydrogenase
MRAALLSGEGDSRTLVVGEIDVPEPGPGEALVRVLMSGICGSDVHFVHHDWARTAFRPIVLGHEAVGLVERHGPGASDPAPGTRVSIHPVVACGSCACCNAARTQICAHRQVLGMDRHGAFADFIVVPAANLVPVPDSLDSTLAAIATDAVATAFHAARRGGVGPGRRVAVWGCGGLGLQAVGVVRALGASEIIAVDPRPDARSRAQETGADVACSPEDAAELLRLEGADVALEFAGTAEAAAAAVRGLTDGGRAVLVGAGPGALDGGSLTAFVMREREVVGSYGSSIDELAEVLAMLADGRLRLPHAIGDVLALEDVALGVDRVRDGALDGGRIVVDIEKGSP